MFVQRFHLEFLLRLHQKTVQEFFPGIQPEFHRIFFGRFFQGFQLVLALGLRQEIFQEKWKGFHLKMLHVFHQIFSIDSTRVKSGEILVKNHLESLEVELPGGTPGIKTGEIPERNCGRILRRIARILEWIYRRIPRQIPGEISGATLGKYLEKKSWWSH